MPADGLSLVIPAYNEAAGIADTLAEAVAVLREDFARYEVLVVDDGSTDDTAAVVPGLGLPGVRVIRLARNQGYGAALRAGFQATRLPLVAFTDADGQLDPRDLRRLADVAAPIAAGYRADRQDPWRRKFLSRGYNRLVRTLLGTGLRDIDCALKVFRREVLADLLPESRGFFVNTEMIARARRLGLPVAELPVAHRPRRAGESKVSLTEVPRTFRTLVAYWWRERVAGPGIAARRASVGREFPGWGDEFPRPAAPAPRSRIGLRTAEHPGG
jgi:dolichol-phosphate mannosyltransferase